MVSVTEEATSDAYILHVATMRLGYRRMVNPVTGWSMELHGEK